MEAWRNFKPGDQVRLVRGISYLEKDLLRWGRVSFTFLRYSKPHGYAVCEEEEGCGSFWLHPESLELEKEGG